MPKIEFDSFMSFCKGLEGQTLRTSQKGAEFVLLEVRSDSLVYQISTGFKRSRGRRWIEAVLNHYEETESLKPVDYEDVTYNVSFMLRLIDLYLEHLRDG